MRKAILIVILCVVLSASIVTGIICYGGYHIYERFQNFPQYAQREVTYKKYELLLKDIDACVGKNNTVLSLAACLERIHTPDELMYFALERDVGINGKSDEGKRINIVRNYTESCSQDITVKNGSGYGNIGEQKIIVSHYDIKKFEEIKRCILYMRYTE